jgi:glutamate synthase domain-containing protein 1
MDHAQHPFLAESQRSSMHGGAHNWDINTYPGPRGYKTTAKHRKFSNVIGVAPNISFDSQGRLITVSIKLNSIELHLLDPETLETIAMLDLPPKASASDNSGGGYFHIDAKDRVLLAPANDTISIYEINESSGSPKWQLAEQYDIAGLLPEGHQHPRRYSRLVR